MGNLDKLIELIGRQLKANEISAATASRIAVGHPYLIYKLRKGVSPNYKTLIELCNVLDLEFYIGPSGSALNRIGHTPSATENHPPKTKKVSTLAKGEQVSKI